MKLQVSVKAWTQTDATLGIYADMVYLGLLTIPLSEVDELLYKLCPDTVEWSVESDDEYETQTPIGYIDLETGILDRCFHPNVTTCDGSERTGIEVKYGSDKPRDSRTIELRCKDCDAVLQQLHIRGI